MKLTTEKLTELAHGAVRVLEENGKTVFHRFTEEQQKLYKASGNDALYKKIFATAGINLRFKTDSTTLFLKINIPFVTTRSYFSVDVCADGEIVGCIDNFSDAEMSGNYTSREYPIGEFEKEFNLGEGIKTVSVFFPWSVPAEILELSLDDGSFTQPVAREKKILLYGDSISQGYDTLNPSNHYSLLLSDLLKADIYNKAIGAEVFVPSLASTEEDFVPDYIIVAYGTNDWSKCERDTFRHNCKEFYEILSSKYPSAKIFAITPIWRADYTEERSCGAFSSVADYIAEVTEHHENVYLINGFDFVPHRESLFADSYLHPNDEGFEYFTKNLYNAIMDLI